MKKYILLYSVVIIIFGLGIYFTLHYGQQAALPRVPSIPPWQASPVQWRRLFRVPYGAPLKAISREPLSRLILQLLVIVIAARLTGLFVSCIGQPAVVGEMLAGILLGPSLFGLLHPEIAAAEWFIELNFPGFEKPRRHAGGAEASRAHCVPARPTRRSGCEARKAADESR